MRLSAVGAWINHPDDAVSYALPEPATSVVLHKFIVNVRLSFSYQAQKYRLRKVIFAVAEIKNQRIIFKGPEMGVPYAPLFLSYPYGRPDDLGQDRDRFAGPLEDARSRNGSSPLARSSR